MMFPKTLKFFSRRGKKLGLIFKTFLFLISEYYPEKKTISVLGIIMAYYQNNEF